MTSGPVVGVDIGGTGIKAAPINIADGQLVGERVWLHTPSPATPQAVADVVGEILQQIGVAGPVGLALPAVVRHGIVETASHIDHSWIGVNAAEHFAKTTGRPVTVLNDADAAGLCAVRFGKGRGVDGVVAFVTLGTGIGTALFTDGRLLPNCELGRLPLHGGPAEDWAAESVREREELSWEEYADRLQDYLELLESMVWPHLIIIGGGVSASADKFLPMIELRTPVVAAPLHNDAGIIGAALSAPEG